jgi:capsular polysaccharide biosynthesis protein
MHSQPRGNKVKLYGIIRSGVKPKFIINDGSCVVSTKRARALPIRYFVSRVNPEDPRTLMRGRHRLRNLVIAGSKNLVLLFPFGWKSIELDIVLPEANSLLNLTLIGGRILVGRDVARLGFIPTKLDQSLEYEFLRNFKSYECVLSWGTIEKNDSTWPTSRSIAASDIATMHGSLFSEFSEAPRYHPYAIEKNLIKGPFSCLSERELRNVSGSISKEYLNNWSILKIVNGTVTHGSVVSDNENIYLLDQSRPPLSLKEGGKWPALLLSVNNSNAIYLLPAKSQWCDGPAIFIGGTNNWMHFILEDIPRIFLAKAVGLEANIPIIYKGPIDEKILTAARIYSGRRIIEVSDFSEIKLPNLYVFNFDNPLPDTSRGNVEKAQVLVNRHILEDAQSSWVQLSKAGDKSSPIRIFIRRERGLFRPLINANRLSMKLRKDFGFQDMYLGQATLDEIIQVFSKAEFVIGEYGAGLGNVIFLQSDAKVIEIRGPFETLAIEYATLMTSLGISHRVILGKRRIISRYGIARGPYRVTYRALRKLILNF